ncbi:MAG: hypothetical protein KJ947_21985 [Alphaproteobacteria bacterium]|nr:hypothetical protein [Alphaproteobacteria bacterium]MBU1552217.1 hypothetical protein [Alphaproteobacteria bacterium]MBU2336873.1 hypothetical protein [Alphaproteobacteria bacterium]MBU2389630.1 hypothetical protein [Alphaproteobacteria bacterium]
MIEILWRNALYYLGLALRHPWHVAAPALLVLGIGVYAISSITRPFYSEALLVMEFQQIPSSLVSPTVTNDRLRFIDQRVLSRSNLAELAERLQLYPELATTAEPAAIAGRMRNQITLRTTFNEGSDGSTGSASVLLGFEHPIAGKTVAVVDELVRMVIDENRRLRTQRASETTEFLQREVEDLAARLSMRDTERATIVDANRDAQPSRLPAMLIELQAREEELVVVQQALRASEEELELLDAQLRVGLEEHGPAGQLRSQIAEVEVEIADKRLVYTDQHPQMRLLRQKAVDLAAGYDALPTKAPSIAETSFAPELALLSERLSQARPRREGLAERRLQLDDRIVALKQTIARVADVDERLTAIDTEREALQPALNEMKGRLATALMGERLERNDAALHVEVLEPPLLPRSPSGPRRLLLFAALAIACAGAGLGGLLAFDVADRRIRGAFDLQEALAGQTLVMVPSWRPPRTASGARAG